MDEYIKRSDAIHASCFGCNQEFSDEPCEPDACAIRQSIMALPTADVVPKSEVEKLEYTLLGVMHSVDKWLEGDELKKDEVNRAITMREKTLRIVENAKSEIAREIFEEIEQKIERDVKFYKSVYDTCGDQHNDVKKIVYGKVLVIGLIHDFIIELKKKYTGEET